MSFIDILSATATLTTIGQFLSGMFTVFKVWRMGTAGELSPFPFLTGVVGCAMWLFYGVVIEDITVYYTNVIGVVLNAFYVLCFLFYTHKRSTLLQQIFVGALFMALVVTWIGSIEEQIFQKNKLGLICVFITLLCCASPLASLQLVIQSKSTDSLPFPLILSMFLVCGQWWIYGVVISDFYMQITNMLGTLIALIQLSLFCLYPAGKKKTSSVNIGSTHLYSPLKTQS